MLFILVWIKRIGIGYIIMFGLLNFIFICIGLWEIDSLFVMVMKCFVLCFVSLVMVFMVLVIWYV